MPDEKVVSQIEELLGMIASLGGARERTGVIPNLEVLDDDPAGLSGYVIVADSRDDDAIPAVKVPGIAYAIGDFVNVLFIEGTEPVAFQQGSASGGSNALWSLVTGTADIYYNDGNVRIGATTAPQTLLHVGSGEDAYSRSEEGIYIAHATDPALIIRDTDNDVEFFIAARGSSSNVLMGTETNHNIQIRTNSSPVLTITNTGEFGFNTTSPQKRAHFGPGTDTPTTSQNGLYVSEFGNTAIIIRNSTNNNEMALEANGGASNPRIGMVTADDLSIITNNVNRMYLDTGGDVAIASTTPGSRLDVHVSAAEAIPTGGDLMAEDSTILRLFNESDTATYSGFGLQTRTTNSARLLIGLEYQSANQGDLFFRFKDGAAASAEVLRITHAGNTTIGEGVAALEVNINGAAATTRDLIWQSAGVDRWILRTDATAESGSNAGSNLSLLARNDAGANIATAFFVRRSDQQFGMGVANPAAKLDISQTDSAGAVPVIRMSQIDIDEPFLLYRGNQTNATLTNSLVREADVSTATRIGWAKIEVDNTGAGGLSDGDYYMPFYTLA